VWLLAAGRFPGFAQPVGEFGRRLPRLPAATPRRWSGRRGRQAIASLRPADLGAVLQTFENCLTAHGVTVPSPPAQGRRAALEQFVAGLRTGSPAQRSALASCSPSGIPG
jgi:hypothetical protein